MAVISRERALALLAGFVFVLGGILGGGAVSPALCMFVELVATFLGGLALAGLIDRNYPRQAIPALALMALICLAPLAQLVPLPANVWQALPGHAVPAEIGRLAGLGGMERPLSLSPEQTRLSALSLVVPVSIFMATLQFGVKERDRILLTIFGFAVASAILGVFQVAAGGGLDLGIYAQVHDGYPIGFFANRNHEADLLLIAIPIAAHLIHSRRWSHRTRNMALAIAVAFFSMAVVATQSRTGVALLPLAWLGTLAVWLGDIRDGRIWMSFGGLLILALVCYAIVRLTPVGQSLSHRFSDVGDDMRPVIWQGTWSAIRTFWPLGSGVGGFVPVYKMFEDLDTVNDLWVNHAHNEYLELVLDSGVVAVILFAMYIVLVLSSLRHDIPPAPRSQRYAAVCAILILILHSLTDYPLRTFSLIAIFAFANALLFPAREIHRIRRVGSHPASPPPVFAMDYNDA